MSSKGAARRRRQKQNALDKCPGYEPSPTFKYLERCVHCGLPKAEHTAFLEQEGPMFSYLESDEALRSATNPAKKGPSEAPLFSYLNRGADGGKPGTQRERTVSSFVPHGPGPEAESFPARHVSRNQRDEPAHSFEDVDLEDDLEHAHQESVLRNSVGSASQSRKFSLASKRGSSKRQSKSNDQAAIAPVVIEEHHEEVEQNSAAATEAKENTPTQKGSGLRESLASRASEAFDSNASLRSVSDMFSKGIPRSESREEQRLSIKRTDEQRASVKHLEEVDTEDLSDDDDQSEDHVAAKSPHSSVLRESTGRTGAALPTERLSSNRMSARSGTPSMRSVSTHDFPIASSKKLSLASSSTRTSRVSGVQRISRFFSQSFRGKKLDDEDRRHKSNSQVYNDVHSLRDAHLQQIQRLLKVTASGARVARNNFRIYEEPSKETLELYHSPAGLVTWRPNMEIGWTRLHVAAWNRDDKRLARDLRTFGEEIDNPAGNTGETALSLAVKRGSQQCTFLLLEAGAAVDDADHFGFTPLHYALRNNDHEIVQMLINAQANVRVASEEYKISALHMACRYADPELVTELLDRQLDVNVRDGRGWTPLFYAVMRPGHTDLVEYLISKKADVRALGTEGLTALHCAVLSDDPEHISSLVERGVRMDKADDSGWTAMHYCARYDAGAALQRLLDYGAFVKPVSDCPFTPYEIALHFGNQSVVRVFEGWPDFVKQKTILDSPELEVETPLGVHVQLDEELDLAELDMLEGIFTKSGGTGSGEACCVIS